MFPGSLFRAYNFGALSFNFSGIFTVEFFFNPFFLLFNFLFLFLVNLISEIN